MKERSKILLIDDDEDFCLYVKKALEAGEEYELTYSLNGPEGIAMAKRISPDLILVDIMMPGMSGDEVAEKLLSLDSTHDIPVAFITALATRKDEGKIGERYFISKPVTLGNLPKQVKSILKTG